MRPRDGRYVPEPDQGAESPRPEPAAPPAEEVAYRVPGRFTVIKFAVALVFALAGVLAHDRVGLVIGLALGIAVAVYTARDLIAPVRLAADRAGVVAVRGYASRVRLGWADIEVVRVDSRLRFGRRSELLELDAGELILQYSEYDLGVSPSEAERALAHLRGS
jgi:hypothetical protein